ncbi:cytochrome c biogenesis protein CcsA [Limibacter armeniacum]|uniref:cytochrome c biogenesis protein CcsA n=1 Tax=Limibacter armeniacum TaxID=466084 RepID=UPI002FE668A4
MIHTFIGELGHSLVIIAFVSALLSAFSYWKSSSLQIGAEENSWRKLARGAFLVHGASVIGVVITLFFIIYNHYYEYHYAWSHSSNNLPTHFMISCFWEGQEGSFLLWIFWHVLIGAVLIKTAKSWENNVMLVFALVQAFLVSMILGIDLLGTNIGSDPFILLRDAIEAPVFATNPNYVPEDGTGLNPLLQNIWMVIHPPTLFLGFAVTLVPFAFVIAGLRTGKYKEWIKPALYWSHFGAFVLGLGIMMGAYWAYETLNFGGYWNWDPVENAVYIPWLIMVASIHVMIAYRKSGNALKSAMILTIATFILILYSTFLTRSGVLGEASVHSFTDLGLSGQLLLYLLAFTVMSVWLLAKHWKTIPSKEEESSVYSSEFWIFIGATVLCLAAFQVLIPTSIPAWNAFWKFFGVESNIAPPADQVEFYTKFQMWFAVGIALLSGTGQFFYWKKLDAKNIWNAFAIPLIVTMVGSAAIMLGGKVQDLAYIVVLTASIYALVSNGMILLMLAKTNFKLSGGAVAHIGMALMIIGILFSSGYEKVISLNLSGRIYNSEFSEEMNKENLLLFRSQPKRMNDYTLTYKGPRMTSRDIPGYINKEDLLFFSDPYRAIAKEDVVYKGTTYAHAGDTIQIYNENTYYEIEYKKVSGEVFTLYPRIQDNAQMGLLPSPDIASYWNIDLYTHITNLAADDEEINWSEPQEFPAAIGDTLIIHDYFVVFDGVSPVKKIVGVDLGPNDVAVEANLRVLGVNQDIKPAYLIKDKQPGMLLATNRDLGLKVALSEIDPQAGRFVFSVNTSQKDWVILKAIEKPLVNILWIGTIVMCIGFIMAMIRRYNESNKIEEKVLKAKSKGVQEVV